MKKTLLFPGIALILFTGYLVGFNNKSYYPSIVQSGTLDFANTTAGTSNDLTMTVTGAVVGDPVLVGPVNGSVSTNGVYFGWVSDVNTVSIRFMNNSLLAGLNPASGVYKVIVFK